MTVFVCPRCPCAGHETVKNHRDVEPEASRDRDSKRSGDVADDCSTSPTLFLRASPKLPKRQPANRNFPSSTPRLPVENTTKNLSIFNRRTTAFIVNLQGKVDPQHHNRKDGGHRLSRDSAHAQVHSQPSSGTQADGRVSCSPPIPHPDTSLRFPTSKSDSPGSRTLRDG